MTDLRTYSGKLSKKYHKSYLLLSNYLKKISFNLILSYLKAFLIQNLKKP
jgi:hypothetical protein